MGTGGVAGMLRSEVYDEREFNRIGVAVVEGGVGASGAAEDYMFSLRHQTLILIQKKNSLLLGEGTSSSLTIGISSMSS